MLSCSGSKGRPASGFEGPGPVAIGPNVINGEGELLFAGGITSHWLYGINLTDFYPFDINGNADGNKIDNLLPIDDIALTPDGRFLLAGGDSVINVYDLLNPGTPVSISVAGWVTSLVNDPLDSAVAFATSWNGTDGFLYKLKVNINGTGEMSLESSQITFTGMLPSKIMLNTSTIQLSPPLIYILFKKPASIKGLDYSQLTSGFVKDIPLPETPAYAVPMPEGNTFYVIFEGSKLAKYTAEGIEIIQSEAPGIAELPRIIDGVPMNIAVLPPSADYPERVLISDGRGYLDILDAETSCPVLNTSYTNKGFTDAGDKSNPSLQEVSLSSCNTKKEDWTISYHGSIFETDRSNGRVSAGESILIDDSVDFIESGVISGDILSIRSGEFAGDYAIIEVVDSNTLKVNTIFLSDSQNLSYNIKGAPYLVKGSISGVQKKRAVENETYISDKGAIGFKIVSGSNPVTEGDTFHLSTTTDRIQLKGLPYGIAVDSSNLIYISNFGSNSISVVDPGQLKVIDTLR